MPDLSRYSMEDTEPMIWFAANKKGPEGPIWLSIMFKTGVNGRAAGIRTRDLLHPKQAR